MYSESNKTELKIELIENVKKEIIAFLMMMEVLLEYMIDKKEIH